MKINKWIGMFVSICFCITGCLDNETDSLDNLLVTVENDLSLTQFAEAVNLSSFATVLEQGVITVFAPSNQAFENYLSQTTYSSISEIPKEELDALIAYHIISGVGESNSITSGYYETLSTNSPDEGALSILIENTNGGISINSSVEVLRLDMQGTNGVIHLIDRVMEGPTVEQSFKNNSSLSILQTGLQRFGIFDSLSNGGIYTLITPPNDAITQFLQDQGLAGVSDLGEESYKKMILRHVIPGNLDLNELEGNTFETLADSAEVNVRISNTSSSNQIFYVINDSTLLLRGNIQARDGILHVVNQVLTDL